MTQGVASAMLTVLALLAALLSYAFIKPALFLALLSAMAFAIFYYCLSPAMKRSLGYRPIMVALAMPLAAWGVPNIWALYAIMLWMVPLFARRPAEVAPLYMFSLLLLPGLDTSIMLGGVKLFEFGVHDALTVGALLRLLLFTEGKVEGFRPLDIPVLLVLLLLVTGLARDTTVTNFVRVLLNIGLDYAVPYFVISRSVRTMDDIRLCMIWLACAAVIISVILLYEVRTGWPMYNSLYDRHGIMTLLLVKMRGGVLRAGGPF
ncbi:MAG TPA: O-antigen ligase domain-containing protein, partial [Rhizorhapis sp.]|nr:O-antigen ligase domain-containing protein [Rhizorhapis sp.]